MENFSTEKGLGYIFPKPNSFKKILFFTLSVFIFFSFFYYLFLSAPKNFPSQTVVRIEEGMTLRHVSAVLKKQNIIRSRTAFESLVIILGGEKHTVSADYLFEDRLSVWQVALRITKGEHYMAPVVVTIPEGFNINQIADTFSSKLTNFNKTNFLLEAKDLEGYLFPDTYFFLTSTDEQVVLSSMRDNFKKKTNSLLSEGVSLGKNEKELLVMASIIEGEAKGDVDRDIISGILWKRIKIGMPLQVDVSPITYREKGLPTSPIGNPGLSSIKASIFPKVSPYLYYLHDRDGNIHYAKTFVEHKQNISRYLKN